MVVECGFYEVDTELKKRAGYRYFVAKHKCNPTNVEIIYVRADKKLEGKKELCEFIKKEKLIT